MPTPTYTPLYSTTLASASASVVIANIPQTYRDLIIVAFTRSSKTATFDYLEWRYNSDTGSNYSRVYMFGDGSSTGSGTNINTGFAIGDSIPAASATSGIFGSATIHIMDYSATDKHKSALIRNDNQPTITTAVANRWASTSAITSITLFAEGGDLVAGTSFSVYGIAA